MVEIIQKLIFFYFSLQIFQMDIEDRRLFTGMILALFAVVAIAALAGGIVMIFAGDHLLYPGVFCIIAFILLLWLVRRAFLRRK